jgi:hypothetical protein
MRARACAAVVCISFAPLFLAPVTARGQARDAVTESARKRFQEGVKYFDQHQYEEARTAFLQAYALKHHPAVLLNLAQSEIRSSHALDAAKHFSAFLRESASMSAAEKGEAEKGLAAARTKIGRLQVQVDAGEAEVFVDGERVGQSPLAEPVDVAPGSHEVQVHYAGKTASATASAPAGKLTTVTLSVGKSSEGIAAIPPPSPPPPSSTPTPSAPPPSNEETAPPAPAETASASTSSSAGVSSSGRPPFLEWVTGTPLGLVTAGVTLVGAGIGIGFYAMAQHVHAKAADNADQIRADYSKNANNPDVVPPDVRDGIANGTRPGICNPTPPPQYSDACSTLRTNLDAESADRSVATVGAVAAGVGLASMVVTYFLTTSPSSSSGSAHATPLQHTFVAPTYGKGTAGLILIGSF